MNEIIWLASWYPNKLHPFAGDFIQRHARVVASKHPVTVFFVIKDGNGRMTNDVLTVTTQAGALTEIITYYKPRQLGFGFVDRLLSLAKYLKTFKSVLASHVIKQGKPALVHVQVAMWAGVVARWFQSVYGINYVITEHWTGYDRRSLDNYYQSNLLFRVNTKRVFRAATHLLPASDQLGRQINEFICPISYTYVPNVVDTNLFNFQPVTAHPFRFVHVSAMGYQKNVDGMLRAFASFLSQQKDWQLVMIGPAEESLKAYASRLGLQDHIVWKGEVSYQEVADEMKQASALVLFSRYENQPCVISEALCCGLPVIATDVGGISELVNEANGLLVSSGDEHGLESSLSTMIQNYLDYDREAISREAIASFNYEVVAQKISWIYEQQVNG